MDARPRILVADDDTDMMRWLRAALRPLDAELGEATTGGQLLDALADDGPFDLVITDVRMPAPDGVSVAAMARATGLQTPFIVITSKIDERLRDGVERLGDAVLLAKPLDRESLLQRAGLLLLTTAKGPRCGSCQCAVPARMFSAGEEVVFCAECSYRGRPAAEGDPYDDVGGSA